MDQIHQCHRDCFFKTIPPRARRIASPILAVASVAPFVAVLIVNLQSPRVTLLLLFAFAAGIVSLAFLLAGSSYQLHWEQRQTTAVLQTTEQEFQQMAGNIQEIFWMIDARSKKAIFVNPAYETITGRSCQSLMENPSSYQEVIHPEDRVHVLARLGEAVGNGHFDERFRIVSRRGKFAGL
jgi:PAS domain S-box-containing protein